MRRCSDLAACLAIGLVVVVVTSCTADNPATSISTVPQGPPSSLAPPDTVQRAEMDLADLHQVPLVLPLGEALVWDGDEFTLGGTGGPARDLDLPTVGLTADEFEELVSRASGDAEPVELRPTTVSPDVAAFTVTGNVSIHGGTIYFSGDNQVQVAHSPEAPAISEGLPITSATQDGTSFLLVGGTNSSIVEATGFDTITEIIEPRTSAPFLILQADNDSPVTLVTVRSDDTEPTTHAQDEPIKQIYTLAS